MGRTLICGGLVCGVVMLGRSPPFGAGFCGYCGAQVPRGSADAGGLSGGGGGGGGASGGGELVSGVVDGAVLTGVDVVASVGVGLLACAILVTNNLRDIPGDTVVGKRTLAVRLGDPSAFSAPPCRDHPSGWPRGGVA